MLALSIMQEKGASPDLSKLQLCWHHLEGSSLELRAPHGGGAFVEDDVQHQHPDLVELCSCIGPGCSSHPQAEPNLGTGVNMSSVRKPAPFSQEMKGEPHR